MAWGRRLQVTVVGALIGTIAAAMVGPQLFNLRSLAPKEGLPAPHTVALVEGRTSLRLAMVHDVLHERYLVHGDAYWTARLKIAKQILDAVNALDGELKEAPDQELLNAFDVYGVSLDKLHRSKEAVAVMRKKLGLFQRFYSDLLKRSDGYKSFTYSRLVEAQSHLPELSETDQALYRTFANLGTFLIHESLGRAFKGDKSARLGILEGMTFVHRSMFVNPGAHFGRETWQLVAVQHLLEGLHNTEFRHTYDLCGGQLLDIPMGEGGLGLISGGERLRAQLLMVRKRRASPEGTIGSAGRKLTRRYIKKVRVFSELENGFNCFVTGLVPFDEPTLGIIGMWTLGGGPNPFFALSLANLMDLTGQKYIAWSGYERAKRMATRFWSRPEDHQFLLELCQQRQDRIEAELPETGIELRAQFDEELAYGASYQKDYIDYEEKLLREGLLPNSEGFYDDFFKDRESISTAPNTEDEIHVSVWPYVSQRLGYLPVFFFVFGFISFLASFTGKKRVEPTAEAQQ
ncbi:MAG: hypothetical protein P1V97_15095 [Planctomycetota bacterium]|nr:hypothetical protein [Planctomycetota bacterium]